MPKVNTPAGQLRYAEHRGVSKNSTPILTPHPYGLGALVLHRSASLCIGRTSQNPLLKVRAYTLSLKGYVLLSENGEEAGSPATLLYKIA